MLQRILVSLLLFAFGQSALAGQERTKKGSGEKVARARKALDKHLQEIKAAQAQVVHIESEFLAEACPRDIFFAARFRQYPVARVLPEGLKPSNLFAVADDDKVRHLRDAKELEKFLKEKLSRMDKQEHIRNTLAAWLMLAQEFDQDGFYRFEVLNKAFTIEEKGQGGWQAAGRALLVQGGNGEIGATMTFEDGKLTKVVAYSKLRPGPRPICQATRLLDPDPVVRKMAEQDLLFMGRAAREYLMEQKARAAPELRRAMDRLWQRIERENPE
jgi:hypothetical protein